MSSMKIIILGDSGVGKTSTINSFTSGAYSEKNQSTIGVDYKTKQMVVDGVTFTVGLWDTAGQERFKALPPQFYRDIHGVILMYDVSSRPSLMKLNVFIEELKNNTSMDEVVCLLIGNKIDTDRAVTTQEARTFAQRHDMMYMELSAKTQEGMYNVFQELVKKILEKGVYDPSGKPKAKGNVQLHDDNKNSKPPENSTCCNNVNINVIFGWGR